MKALRFFTALLLIFFVLNYCSRKLLPFAYADVADYSLLYTTDHSVYISKLEVVNDSLDILFNGPLTNSTNRISWHNTGKDGGTDSGTFIFTGNRLRYHPPASRPQALRLNGDSINTSYAFNVSYTPGSSLPFEVTSADMAIEPAVVRPVEDWIPDDWAKDKQSTRDESVKFLQDSSGIWDTDSTVQKILKIGRLVLSGMPADSGRPSDSISALHPYQQYQLAKAGRANLWCGNYAAIFSYFATLAGIPTRTVFTGTSKQNLGLGNHVFCEAYIKEQDRWAYVDLTSNTVLLQLGDRYLNVVDLQRLLCYAGSSDNIISYSVAGDSVQKVPFDSMARNARYYFTKNAFFTFFYKDYFSKYSGADVVQRIKNLFITRPMYAIYSDNLPGRNYHFLARIISNYLLVAAVLAWLFIVLTWLLRKIKRRS